MTRGDLAELDRRYIWHPFTQQQGWLSEDAPIIRSANGCTLTDVEGRVYIDGVSSLWCNVHGHQHPKIDKAVRDQLGKVAHTTMLGLSHEPGIQLAERLIEIAPERLTRVFYSDSGSTATEIALKIAFQHFQQCGQAQRTRFMSLRDAYHGDTIGAVSAGGIDLFHATYGPLLFDTIKTASGDFEELERNFEQHGRELAALIMEPLVQGAAGMIMHPNGFLRKARELCDKYGVLLILDEVATGFGRTGTMFACQQETVEPDIMCIAKGITGGYLPLAATLTTEIIYSSFLGDHAEQKTFFHGHTYTGNPLACAAGLATLDVFEQEQTMDHVADLCVSIIGLLEPIAALPRVKEIRRRGLMVGIELDGFPAETRAGHQVTLAARRRGAIIRPLGDTVVLMPPLAISEPELRRLIDIVGESIAEVSADASSRQEPTVSRAKVKV
ncbi:MAG: adenosylmethionine--8-amino-7-oxononanoate transaminase [Solirubrobacterales bacterium]|nr:adenosylmethionine--8-amino-7-oxononanoate transaminase [Solirubrobacterales bacterium]